MTISLFDQNPQQPPSSPAQDAPAAQPRTDILRPFPTKYGPLRELREGKATGREFSLVELEDGRIMRQFGDGARELASESRRVIGDGLAGGTLVEIFP